ncbi:hypothetical protein [Desulfogranum marinum]|uniref:hypothetical protein n=1 Tax=Desulfogranum marinum TaxID=453220 RepID=UPI001965E502|nr:hypothetical protein [Desulfogranum marinum]MBM9514200.1 hypothetical protein [Desulfogranum marinum]
MKKRECKRSENDWRDTYKSLAMEDTFYSQAEKDRLYLKKSKRHRPVHKKWED